MEVEPRDAQIYADALTEIVRRYGARMAMIGEGVVLWPVEYRNDEEGFGYGAHTDRAVICWRAPHWLANLRKRLGL